MRRALACILTAIVATFASVPTSHAAREVSANRECAICHIAWLADFNIQGATPLVPHEPKQTVASGRQDVVSTERMCLSCHDGFVRDSRAAFANRQHFHPVGVKPSDKINIPVKEGKLLFPLNDDGKVYCGTCHSAHTVDWNAKKVGGMFLRSKNVDSSMCIACHLERSTGSAEGNHPIFKPLREAPESLVAAGARFGENNTVICQSCHRPHGATEKKLLVVRNENSELCGSCHTDRYAKDLTQAGRMGTHPVNVRPSKATIPETLLASGGRLGNGGTVICETCHRPHFAEAGAKILVARNDKSSLCQSCHTEQRKVASTKHNMNLLDPLLKNVKGQEVGHAGVCSSCHLPHGGRGPKMWARAVTESGDPMADLCLSCHREGGSAEKKQVGEHSHPVGRDMSRLGKPVDFPGYSVEGVKHVGDAQGRVTCASCHDPHRWDARDPEKTSKPGDPSGPGDKFLRQPHSADAALCLACHKGKDSVINTKHDLSIMAPEERNVRGQSATQAGPCGNCHLTHNGNGPRMWARPIKNGVDPVAATCLSCHDEKGVAHNKQIGGDSHPVGVPITRLGIEARIGAWRSKNGATDTASGKLLPLPLFDAKGAPASEGGNVTCATCHDPHQWSAVAQTEAGSNPKEVRGTGLSRFLRMPYDREAKLCGNCHGDKVAISLSKHNLQISAPQDKNIRGQTPAETGVCSACHLPHNGSGSRMWARGAGPGGDEIEKRCADCHREGGIAKRKLTGPNSHPLGVDPKKLGVTTSLPLYTPDGKTSAEAGRVSCATCHDLHRWDAASITSRAGADAAVEGTARDSFLRKPAAPAPELCVDCHQSKRWVKNTEHDLAVTAPLSSNVLGQNVAQSGPCGQCHLPHNAADKTLLWARQPGVGADRMERYCRSCHAAGAAAAAKQPLKANHPSTVNVLSTQQPRRDSVQAATPFPLFKADGQRTPSGLITCPTCHDPHQWRANKAEEGPGKNEEGDAMSSFLRNVSDYGLCTDCHGLDAIFRYKYFHGESSRVKHPLSR